MKCLKCGQQYWSGHSNICMYPGISDCPMSSSYLWTSIQTNGEAVYGIWMQAVWHVLLWWPNRVIFPINFSSILSCLIAMQWNSSLMDPWFTGILSKTGTFSVWTFSLLVSFIKRNPFIPETRWLFLCKQYYVFGRYIIFKQKDC